MSGVAIGKTDAMVCMTVPGCQIESLRTAEAQGQFGDSAIGQLGEVAISPKAECCEPPSAENARNHDGWRARRKTDATAPRGAFGKPS